MHFYYAVVAALVRRKCTRIILKQVCTSVWSVGMSCSPASPSMNIVLHGRPSLGPSTQTQSARFPRRDGKELLRYHVASVVMA
ncbi:hypothetical protein Pcinc_017859 [Petrolisthes cinctipes]|uniref:Uncharacterized protein n=1 Tax=Petrolisthes cinctipes TaxID=88211 RepID=A0AAE1KN32_PETCI|nr:hypothetical protein Pcinc_017859 [Petrolisthes cinctipes]